MGTPPQTAGGEDGRRRTRRRRRPASPADMPEHAPAPQQADSAATPADMPVHAQREPTNTEGGPNNRRAGSRNDRHPDANGESARRADAKMEKAERGLRGLIGAGPSQLAISAAMRARDAARPTDQDLAAADKLPIVRRNYIPPSGEITR